MNCWHCDRPAHGVCVFCGRALCKECKQEMPHIIAVYTGKQRTQRAIVTAKALFCGECEPCEDPIDMPELG